MKNENSKQSTLSLDQIIPAIGAGLFTAISTLYLIYSSPESIEEIHASSEAIRNTIFDVGIISLGYISAITLAYLAYTKPNED